MACMVQTLCSDFFGIGGREPLSWHVASPQLALTQKLLELIRQLWCKLCDTLATISFVFEGGDLLSSHFWTEYGINTVSRRRN